MTMTNRQAKSRLRHVPFHPDGPSQPDLADALKRIVNKQLRRVLLGPGLQSDQRAALREQLGNA